MFKWIDSRSIYFLEKPIKFCVRIFSVPPVSIKRIPFENNVTIFQSNNRNMPLTFFAYGSVSKNMIKEYDVLTYNLKI